MRSEFRFPKATVTLMTVILLAIFLAIDKAKAIQASIPYANPQVGPIHPTQQLMLLPTLLFVLAGACVTAALGWGILFALHVPAYTGSRTLMLLAVGAPAAACRFKARQSVDQPMTGSSFFSRR